MRPTVSAASPLVVPARYNPSFAEVIVLPGGIAVVSNPSKDCSIR